MFGRLTPAGLTQASGEPATGAQQTTFDAMNLFMGVLTDPFIDGRGDSASRAVARRRSRLRHATTQATGAARDAYAMFTKAPPVDRSSSAGACGPPASAARRPPTATRRSDRTTRPSRIYGTAVGADYRFSPYTMAGFALAGGGTNFSVADGGTGRSDLFQAGAFIRHTVGPAYLSGALAYGWQDVTTDRTVTVAGIDQLRAAVQRQCLVGPRRGRLSLCHAGRRDRHHALCRGQFTTFDLPAYAEQAVVGANTFALAYGAKSVTDTRSELGLRTDKSFAMHDGDPHAARPRRLGARLQSRPQHRRDVPDAARRVLRRQRRGAGRRLRAASPPPPK